MIPVIRAIQVVALPPDNVRLAVALHRKLREASFLQKQPQRELVIGPEVRLPRLSRIFIARARPAENHPFQSPADRAQKFRGRFGTDSFQQRLANHFPTRGR